MTNAVSAPRTISHNYPQLLNHFDPGKLTSTYISAHSSRKIRHVTLLG